MDILCRINRQDVALLVFEDMNHQCCYPDKESYTILMKGLCQDGRLTEATHLLYSMLWRITHKGCGEDIVIYRTLLDSLCDNGKVNEAVEILGKILRKGLKFPKSCSKLVDIAQLRDTKDVKNAEVLINEALIRGVIPNSSSYTAVANDLYMECKICEADKVLEELCKKRFRPTLRTCEKKVAAMCLAGTVDEAGWVIEEMLKRGCVPNSVVYDIVVKKHCSEGKLDMVIGFLEKMDRQKGSAPRKETFSVIVDGLCGDGKFIEASKILERMLSKSFLPEPGIFNALIKGLCSIDRIYEAILWLEEMISQGKAPDPCIWSLLVASISSNVQDRCVHFEILYQLRNTSLPDRPLD